jgi:hypothetical protein
MFLWSKWAGDGVSVRRELGQGEILVGQVCTHNLYVALLLAMNIYLLTELSFHFLIP